MEDPKTGLARSLAWPPGMNHSAGSLASIQGFGVPLATCEPRELCLVFVLIIAFLS